MTPRRPFRAAVALIAGLLSLLEAGALVQTVRSQGLLREALLRRVRSAVEAARPRLALLLRPGGAAAWEEAAREVLAYSLAAEVEVFDLQGRRLAAYPGPSAIDHWIGAEQAGALGPRSVVSFGPFLGRSSRILTYAAFASGGGTVVLRLSAPATELVEDLRERRQVVLGHGLAMALLALLAGLALLPGRETAPAPAPLVLGAYEEAMERLRDRGEALSREHASERRRMEERIHDTEAMARAGELTAGIVHEVRNGLGTILGYARLLERDPASPEAAEAGPRIREECETLETVVRRFMDFVKSETVNRAPFDVGRMLSRVVAREVRGRPGVRTSLVGVSDGVAVVGDEELLERAFENIVRNAADAAGSGGHVSVEVGREQGSVAVSIADDGPGMPRERRRDIRPFFSSKPGGLGLGLPIAIKIVRLHGGELALGDRDPHGLRVTVMLPSEGPPA